MIKILKKNFDIYQKDIFFISLIVIAAGLIRIYIFKNLQPDLYPDSESYIKFAQSLKSLHFPSIILRTPGYPLFILPFMLITHNYLSWVVFFQIILGIISLIFLYLIINKLTNNKILAFILTLMMSFNYTVFNFETTILTETLSLFLLILTTFFHINLLNDFSNQNIIKTIITDLLLIFTRPIFILLPIIFYLYYFILWLIKILPKTKKVLKLIALAVIINALAIGIWGALFRIQQGYFSFSAVSNINTLGRILEFDLASESPNDQYKEITQSINQRKKMLQNQKIFPYNPYFYLDIFPDNYQEMKNFNYSAISKNKYQYIKKGIIDLPNVIKDYQNNYSSQPFLFNHFINQMISKLSNFLSDYLGKIIKILFLFFMIIFLYFFINFKSLRKNKKFINNLSSSFILLVAIIYTYLIITFQGYSEFSRLSMPIFYFNCLFPIIFIFLFIRLILNKKEKYEKK